MTATVHVGIDVACSSLSVCILKDDETCEEFSTTNDSKGHNTILQRIGKHKATAQVCLEATSTYHWKLCHRLHGRQGITVYCTDPRSSSDFRKLYCKRAKTDKLDARGLASFVRAIPMHPWEPPRQALRELRDLGRRCAQVRKDHAATRNRMHAAKRGGCSGQLLAEYRHAIDFHKREIQRLRKMMRAIISADTELESQFGLLLSVQGIGEVSALAILAELACLPKALGKKQLVAMAGMDPQPRESGNSNPPRHMSKRGNARLRLALFMPAMVAIRHCRQVRDYYEYMCDRGKPKLCALFAVMRKMLLAIWGMLATQTEWDPQRFSQRFELTSK